MVESCEKLIRSMVQLQWMSVDTSLFNRAGLGVNACDIKRYPPLDKQSLSQNFSHLLEDDLRIFGFDVLLSMKRKDEKNIIYC